MTENELTLQRGKPPRLPIVLGAVAVVMLVGAGALAWVLYSRLQDMQAQLAAMERRAASAEQDALKKSHELNSTQSALIAAQDRALRAERRSYELSLANRESEAQVQQLRQESETVAATAEQASRQAEQAAAQARQAAEEKAKAMNELAAMRQRRMEELNRMQEALNRVAPTRRTPTGMVLQLANDSFNFDFDSAALKPQNRETLSRIAGILLASEGYRLFVDGHTDDIGTDEYNKGLSERRAQSVRDYLVKAGIPADIITVNGFGKANPLVKGKSREAREKNRRVEIGIVDTIITYDTAAAQSRRAK
jgi:outer membrane protein OmpA-like peptidoglycan-associated protein